MSQTIEEKLAGLGVAEKNIRLGVEIFRKVSSIADLTRELGNRRLNCDAEQYLSPIFRKLYQQSSEVRERVELELGSLGVPVAIVTEFFTGEGYCPGTSFHLHYEDTIQLETRERFVQKADELMLTLLREYLGVM